MNESCFLEIYSILLLGGEMAVFSAHCQHHQGDCPNTIYILFLMGLFKLSVFFKFSSLEGHLQTPAHLVGSSGGVSKGRVRLG